METQASFIKKIQQHKGLLNKLIFLYADFPEDREDLRQEILLQAWKSYPKFKGDAEFSTWLYRIGINVGITTLSKRKRAAPQQLEPNLDLPKPHKGTGKELLELILKQLNPIDRTLIILLIEGYKQTEIAEMLGISAENVRTKLFRIRKKLQKNGIKGYLV